MDFNKHVPLDYPKAAEYFARWKTLCDKDGGKLWGVNLHTPFAFVDPHTRDAVANTNDNEGIFTKQGDVYVGKYPSHLPVSNSAFEFGGKRWGTAMWNTIDNHDAIGTVVHEAFHCLQPSLFAHEDVEGNTDHLANDTNARISLLVEIEALRHAMQTSGKARHDAVQAAICAREYRRNTFASHKYENEREMCEGTAVYTEYMIAYSDSIHEKLLEYYVWVDALQFSFGYILGATYCYLLDMFGLQWKSGLKRASDLGKLLKTAADITNVPSYNEMDFTPYGYEKIASEEYARAEEKAKLNMQLTEFFTQQPTLHIYEQGDLAMMGMPITVPELGMVIRGGAEFFGGFGKLFLRNGALLSGSEFVKVTAEALTQDNNKITGKGWDMELASSHVIKQDGNNFVVVKK